jgi:hypothetical protein
MSKDDLNVIANAEQPDHSSRYSTSKAYDSESSTFGFRGEGVKSRSVMFASSNSNAALASVADLSILEISSRTASSSRSWSIILKVRFGDHICSRSKLLVTVVQPKPIHWTVHSLGT